MVLALRPQGEGTGLLEVFTEDRGRHVGLVRGAFGKKLSAVLMPGNQVAVHWRGRVAGGLGFYQVEPLKARAAALLSDREGLAALSAICALLARALPEREAQAPLYHASLTLIEALDQIPDWPVLYAIWEYGLLGQLGFGLDLSACAVTGAQSGLAYVSPKTGRAVTAEAARGWEDRLLPLPQLFTDPTRASAADLMVALRLTGHFLTKGLASGPHPRPLPEARVRLLDLLERRRKAE